MCYTKFPEFLITSFKLKQIKDQFEKSVYLDRLKHLLLICCVIAYVFYTHETLYKVYSVQKIN